MGQNLYGQGTESFEGTLTSVLHLDTSFLMAGQTTTGIVEWLSHCIVLTYHFNLDDNFLF